jgi:hypothetical protein
LTPEFEKGLKELDTLAELLQLKIIEKGRMKGSDFPIMTVKGVGNKRVLVTFNYNVKKFWATDRIPDIPMRIFGHGIWVYTIEI